MNLERRITRLEAETGIGEPVELRIQTGVPRFDGDPGIRSLLFPDGMGPGRRVIVVGHEGPAE